MKSGDFQGLWKPKIITSLQVQMIFKSNQSSEKSDKKSSKFIQKITKTISYGFLYLV